MSTKNIHRKKPSFSLFLSIIVIVMFLLPSGTKRDPLIPTAITEVHAAEPAIADPVAPSQPSPLMPQSPYVYQPAPEPEPATHPNYPYHVLMAPNDPSFGSQWGLSAIGAPRAWDITTGTNSPIVAVIDTGFALNHPDMSAAWATNTGEIGVTSNQGPTPNCTSRGLTLDKSCNNYDDDNDGYKDNWRGWDFVNNDNDPQAGAVKANGSAVYHGTFVSGIIGARGNNGIGIAGLSWGVRIMPLQVMDDDGNGYTDDIATSVRYAADHGAKVINLSLGTTFDDAYARSAINYAINLGVSVVAAAGNDGCNCLSYPAKYTEVISVGASDQNDARATFSSYGSNLDIVAPGTGICSTMYPSGYSCGGAGTSFAAPHVAGTLALMLARQSDTPAAALQTLLSAAYKVSGMSGSKFSTQYGYGRLDTYNSLLSDAEPTGVGGNEEKIIHVAAAQNVVTICSAPSGTSCTIRLTGPSSQIINLPVQVANRWGDAIIYWNPAESGLMIGTWKLESISNNQISSTASYVIIE